MKKAANARDVMLVAGLTAIAVMAFATHGAMSDSRWVPAPNVARMLDVEGSGDFEESRGAHAAADAHRHDDAFRATSAPFDQRMHREPRT